VLVVGLEVLLAANGEVPRPKRLVSWLATAGWENKLVDPVAPNMFDGAADVCGCEPANEKMGAALAVGAAGCCDGPKGVKEGLLTPFALAPV
jgi:hypothetical protein